MQGGHYRFRRSCASGALLPHARPSGKLFAVDAPCSPLPLQTAIMAVADLYLSYGDALLPHTDVGGQAKPLTSLLAQVLLKASSNDKKFVIEEAQRALQVGLGGQLLRAALQQALQ